MYTCSPSIQRGESEDHTLIWVQSDVCMQSTPKPSDKDNQSLTSPKQALPPLTGMELKSHTASCTSALYPFYFNLRLFKYVYSFFTFPSTMLFSPMQWNLWLMCWPHFLPEGWARQGGHRQTGSSICLCSQAEGHHMGCCLEQKQSNNCSTWEFNNHLCHQLPLGVV